MRAKRIDEGIADPIHEEGRALVEGSLQGVERLLGVPQAGRDQRHVDAGDEAFAGSSLQLGEDLLCAIPEPQPAVEVAVEAAPQTVFAVRGDLLQGEQCPIALPSCSYARATVSNTPGNA